NGESLPSTTASAAMCATSIRRWRRRQSRSSSRTARVSCATAPMPANGSIAAPLKADLAAPPTIDANTRFKYSNHGYGRLGLLIGALTGRGYGAWIKREIIDAAGLTETLPDAPPPRRMPFARGHTGKLPLGERRVIPGETATNALASATGFVSTAGD